MLGRRNSKDSNKMQLDHQNIFKGMLHSMMIGGVLVYFVNNFPLHLHLLQMSLKQYLMLQQYLMLLLYYFMQKVQYKEYLEDIHLSLNLIDKQQFLQYRQGTQNQNLNNSLKSMKSSSMSWYKYYREDHMCNNKKYLARYKNYLGMIHNMLFEVTLLNSDC